MKMSAGPIICVKHSPEVLAKPEPPQTELVQKESNRRACGCVRTSEKLRNILKTFPQPPPPSAITPPCKTCKEYIHINPMGIMTPNRLPSMNRRTYIAGVPAVFMHDIQNSNNFKQPKPTPTDSVHKDACYTDRPIWMIMKELVSLIQMSVTATALVVYYLIYCYMQLIYYTLRSAVYFHQADASMKITITIATITGIIISFYCIMRIEHLIGIHLRDILRYI